MLKNILSGKASINDLVMLEDVAKKIMGRTICALGDAAAMPVLSFIENFRDEFAYFIENKKSMVSKR